MTSDPWKELGFAIRQARLDLGWSMSDLAGNALGNEARKGYVGQVEKGARNLSPETIDKFDQALDLPADIVKAAQSAPPPARDNQEETAKSEKVDQVAEKLITEAEADDTVTVTGERLLIDLAYDLAEGKHNDLFTAYKGLRAALEAAQELKAQGNLPQNTSSQLDAVLRRVSEMNEEGDLDGAAEVLAAEEKRLEAEIETLFNARLEQDRVRNRLASELIDASTQNLRTLRAELDSLAPASVIEPNSNKQAVPLSPSQLALLVSVVDAALFAHAEEEWDERTRSIIQKLTSILKELELMGEQFCGTAKAWLPIGTLLKKVIATLHKLLEVFVDENEEK